MKMMSKHSLVSYMQQLFLFFFRSFGLCGCLLLCIHSTVRGDYLALTDRPLSLPIFAVPTDAPNIMMILDNSSSMHESLTTRDHWRLDAYTTEQGGEKMKAGSWMSYSNDSNDACSPFQWVNFEYIFGVYRTSDIGITEDTQVGIDNESIRDAADDISNEEGNNNQRNDANIEVSSYEDAEANEVTYSSNGTNVNDNEDNDVSEKNESNESKQGQKKIEAKASAYASASSSGGSSYAYASASGGGNAYAYASSSGGGTSYASASSSTGRSVSSSSGGGSGISTNSIFDMDPIADVFGDFFGSNSDSTNNGSNDQADPADVTTVDVPNPTTTRDIDGECHMQSGISSVGGVGTVTSTIPEAATVQFSPAVAKADWRVYSQQFNSAYYNPDFTYLPWPGLPNSDFHAAKFDPRFSEKIDLGSEINGGDGFIYIKTIDDKGFSGDQPNSFAMSKGGNGIVDLWDSHLKYTVSSDSVKLEHITYGGASGTDIVPCPRVASSETLPYSSCLNTQVIHSQVYTGLDKVNQRTVEEEKQNIANWFTYYRSRILVATSVIGNIMSMRNDLRLGFTSINNWEENFVDIKSVSKDHLYDILTGLYSEAAAGRTPLRQGLSVVGEYFSGNLNGKTSPIESQCQRNISLVLTDGEWNETLQNGSIGNEDGDPYHQSLADVAKYYYDEDLSPLPNILPTNDFNKHSHQHMNTAVVAYGLTASLKDTDGDLWPNPPLKESDDWGDINAVNGAAQNKVNDMWHAAYNSKGLYMETSYIDELIRGFGKILNETALQGTGYNTNLATNSQRIQPKTMLYQTSFNTMGWTGNLRAFRLDQNTGNILGQEWDVQEIYEAGFPKREIISFNPVSRQGIPFRWPQGGVSNPSDSELSSWQILHLLKGNRGGEADAYGEDVIKYLRAESTVSTENKLYKIRGRTNLLGDILHSDPVYVGSPNRGYRYKWPEGSLENDDPYINFMAQHKDRTPMIYVGANDGMLHGFNADEKSQGGGQELLAYVPVAVYPRLTELTNPFYQHLSYVDGNFSVEDAYFSQNKRGWRTVLVGTLRNGGQGIYALDITDPNDFSESNAKDIALWEITDQDDPDLGYSYGAVSIGRLPNGQWVAIFSNGYNNTAPDGYASVDGNAKLFVVDLETGAITKIDTGVGQEEDIYGNRPNGLGSPTLVDSDLDFISDRVYAGDLFGNLWKFDFSNVTSKPLRAKEVKIEKLFKAESSNGVQQSITAQPEVSTHPSGEGVMVYFGTGKYIEVNDIDTQNQATQSMYGIWDKHDGDSVLRRELLEQSIIGEVPVKQRQDWDNDGVNDLILARIQSSHPINWTDTPEGHKGWFFDLVDPNSKNNLGERIIARPLIRNDRVTVTTMMSPVVDCTVSTEGWTMEVSRVNGGAFTQPTMDIDGNGVIEKEDLVTFNGVMTAPGGIKVEGGQPTLPTVLTNNHEKEHKFIGTSSGQIKQVISLPSFTSKRVQWMQLK